MLEKDLILDKRIIHRNIQRGNLTEEQYKKAIASLPDLSAKAIEVQSEVKEGDYEFIVVTPEE